MWREAAEIWNVWRIWWKCWEMVAFKVMRIMMFSEVLKKENCEILQCHLDTKWKKDLLYLASLL